MSIGRFSVRIGSAITVPAVTFFTVAAWPGHLRELRPYRGKSKSWPAQLVHFIFIKKFGMLFDVNGHANYPAHNCRVLSLDWEIGRGLSL